MVLRIPRFLRQGKAVGNRARAVFVHIPKAAGGSIRHFCYRNDIRVAGHDTRDASFQRAFEIDGHADLFSFTFVRNPFQRAMSAFRFLVEGGIVEGDKVDSEKFVSKYDGDFEKFVLSEFEAGDVLSQIHFRPQSYWVCDGAGNLCVDFVGRYETLARDFGKITRLFGDPKYQLPVRNRSPDSVMLSMTPRVEAVLRSCYRKDFELFGYR